MHRPPPPLAVSDAELRQTMNVEDEYYSAIENRDTAIMLRDEKGPQGQVPWPTYYPLDWR